MPPIIKPELYFKNDIEWREWLLENHNTSNGVYLIFYKVENKEESMRWEEAVKVALCFGWIDSTVKSLGNGKRRQYFCRRNSKSVWSALNKRYVKELISDNLMHQNGLDIIKIGKENGSWSALNDVVISAPKSNFSSDETSVIQGNSINYIDTSTGEPLVWEWTFEGGLPKNSSLQKPTVTYINVGTYTTTLKTTNSVGTNTKEIVGYITVTENNGSGDLQLQYNFSNNLNDDSSLITFS